MKLPYHVHKAIAYEFNRVMRDLFTTEYFYKMNSHEDNCDKLKELLSSLCDNDVAIIDEYHQKLVAYQEVHHRLAEYFYAILDGVKYTEPRYDGTFVVDYEGNVVKPEQRNASAQ